MPIVAIPRGSNDERWGRLIAELRENQQRVAAEPPARIPFTAIVVLSPLLFLVFCWLGGARLIIPLLELTLP